MYSPASGPATKAYQQIDTNSQVDDASPHRLIQLLMERALAKIGLARLQLKKGEIQEKGHSISGAISIIDGLQASLNHKADQRMSENFDALYAYMIRQLLQANLKNDESILEEVSGLLRELKEAWDAIAGKY